MSRKTFAAIMLVFASGCLFAGDLTVLLKDTGDFGSLSPDAFMNEFKGEGFLWLTDAKDGARSAGSGLVFSGQKVVEAVVFFEDAKVSRVELSFYNRGDLDDLKQDDFDAVVRAAKHALNTFVGKEGVLLPKKKLLRDADVSEMQWDQTDKYIYQLKWSSTGKRKDFKAEYVKLSVFPFDVKKRLQQVGTKVVVQKDQTASAKEVKANIERNEDGDVFLKDFPMVDQGQKGYCAAATVERVLRYYGSSADQHVIAQIAESDRESGTNPMKMMEMLKKTGAKFGVVVKDLGEFNIYKFSKLLAMYNTMARKEGKKEITQGGNVIDINKIYDTFDPELLKKVRVEKMKMDYQQFLRDVTKHIDAGIPILWCMQLGLVKENPDLPQARGGHIRLVIGYNSKTSELVYTDSWGKGHEFKKMGYGDAWTITQAWYSLDPQRK